MPRSIRQTISRCPILSSFYPLKGQKMAKWAQLVLSLESWVDFPKNMYQSYFPKLLTFCACWGRKVSFFRNSLVNGHLWRTWFRKWQSQKIQEYLGRVNEHFQVRAKRKAFLWTFELISFWQILQKEKWFKWQIVVVT